MGQVFSGRGQHIWNNPNNPVSDKLVAFLDGANKKSYTGTGTEIKSLVANIGVGNTLGIQTFNSSGSRYIDSYFDSRNSASKTSLDNISVDPSDGGFTVCMLVNSQSIGNTTGNPHWNYWFKQQSSDNTKLVEIGAQSNNELMIKDDISEVYYGEELFTTVGQHTWNVPVGVTSITAVCVGGGGGGGGKHGSLDLGYGGGGGGLAYGTWSVSAGDVLYIQVGAGGSGGLSTSDQVSWSAQDGSSGDPSYIKITGHGATGNDIQLLAEGGSGGLNGSISNGSRASGGGSSGSRNSNGLYTGGVGGRGSGTEGGGGGGACGYGGNGGNGGDEGPGSFSSSNPSTAGAGGGGGGGGSSSGNHNSSDTTVNANSGGGVGIYGAGSNGSAGADDAYPGGSTNIRGRGGSGGTDGSTSYDYQASTTSPPSNTLSDQKWLTGGGLYGGGGGGGLDGSTGSFSAPNFGNSNYSHAARPGGQGAVRIVWSTGNRQYPTTNVGDGTFPLNKRTVSLNASGWTFVTFGVTSDYKTFTSVNGESKTTGSVTDWNNSETINFTDIFGDGTTNFSCFWNSCMIYDKELSDSEIEQNYNVFKERFDI